MSRRGRSVRERSRDQSRLFSRVGDRDRDYDSRYRREERHPSGLWGEDLDRRGEERRRDERLHPPPPLTSLPPPPTGPLLGPGHLAESASFARDASKGPSARRESRDSARDIPPVDTARRHSGGSSSLSLPPRKEFSEPSPRERGMIGDPPAALPRRQIPGPSWQRDRDRDRDDERARSDTVRSRKNSLERNTDLPSHSPIAESPRSFIPPASPATSISAGTTSAAPATSMAPSAPLPLAANPTISVENKSPMFARIFQEAAYAYNKYLEIQSNLKVAEKERNDHAEHFNAFPALKDRYEGNLKAAKKEHLSATEILSKKSTSLERFCSKLIEERLSQRDAESAVEFCDKIRKELGNSPSLTQFVKSSIPTPVPAPSKDEFQQLRNEVREMKKKQDEEEKTRQNLANEFLNYKNEQANRLRNQDNKLNRLENAQTEFKANFERIKDEQRKTSEELKKAVAQLMATKDSVDKLEDTSNQKSGGDVVMADSVNEGVLSDVYKNLENIQKNVEENKRKIWETSTKFKDIDDAITLVKNEAKTLQQKVSNLEASGIVQKTEPEEIVSGEHGRTTHENCATKADIERLALNIKSQDEILDEFRTGAEKDTGDILEEIQTLDQKTEAHIQATGEKIQAVQKINEEIVILRTQQEEVKAKQEAELNGISERFEQHFLSFHNKFLSEVERLDHKVAFVENQLESHVLAITHQEQKMNNFTTKDFYERVVQSLVHMNPLLFNYTNQLQLCSNEIKNVKENVRGLTSQLEAAKQRLAVVAQSPRPTAQERPSIDGSSNGAGIKSDRSSEGPSSSINVILRDLEIHSNEIKKIDQQITNHIETYTAKMNDIKEWTVSATQRLAENTDSVNIAMDEIKRLRAYLSTTHQRSGSPQIPPPTAAMDRWRAVGGNQEAMQGLPDENGTV